MKPAALRSNLLLQSSSAGRHGSADTADWSGTWVCVGFVEQLTEVGAVLPATIGHHAVHVRRTAAGLLAAINARPFGGCMSVPVHCASTRNVKCPHLACAFSADDGVLDAGTDPDGRARVEFIGDGRRTVEVSLAQRGPLLFVNVTLEGPPPLPIECRIPPGPQVAAGSQLVPGNWLTTPQRAASTVGAALGSLVEVSAVAPNLALVRAGPDTYAVLSHPAGPTRSTLVWALHRRPGSAPVLDGGAVRDGMCAMSRRA